DGEAEPVAGRHADQDEVRDGVGGRTPEIQVRLTRLEPVGVALERADDHVGVAVAVHVSGRGHRAAKTRERGRAGEDQVGDRVGGRAAEVDIGAASVVPARVVRIGPDDHIRVAVAVHVAGRGYGDAEQVAGRFAGQHQVGDRVGGRAAEVDIGAAGI